MAYRAIWTVAYRMGGTANPTWHKTIAFATREEANRVRARIEREGRKALVFTTTSLEANGLPEGHCLEAACACRKEVP